jgi:hypothetical protein
MMIGLILYLMGIMQSQTDSHLYISDKSNGHKIEFLIVTKDSIIEESYILHLKLQKRLQREIFKVVGDKLSITIVNECEDVLFGDKCFKKEYIDNQFGDYELLYPGFGGLPTKEKLNVCRNKYFVYNPPKRFRKIARDKIDDLKQSDFLLPHHIFLNRFISSS